MVAVGAYLRTVGQPVWTDAKGMVNRSNACLNDIAVLPSIKDHCSDRTLGQSTIVLGGNHDHGSLTVSDEDELGVGASTTDGSDSADEVPRASGRTGGKVASCRIAGRPA
jgi:hypothetical protein